MNTIKINSTLIKICLSVFALVLIFSTEASAKKIKFLTSQVVPAARGYAKIKHDSNKNTVVAIKISNLSEVTRLDPSRLFYIVWMVTDEGITKNIGKIDSSSGFLSKQLKASFETVTSFQPMQFFITAENDASSQYPDSQVILTTGKFQLR